MKLYKTSFYGNPNVGLYGFCTDSYCLLAHEFTEEQVKNIKEVLQVPVYQIKIANSSLIGALVTGNSKVLLVPNIALKSEIEHFKELKINVKVIQTKLTALGNNILCNDNGALVNREYSADTKKIIRQALEVTLHPGEIGTTDVPGSCVVHNKKGAIIHAFATPEQITEVENLLGLTCTRGTVSFGSPHVRSGILANSYGMVVGDTSTGIEIENIYEALGFLE
jgi:translation initiation factor 6